MNRDDKIPCKPIVLVTGFSKFPGAPINPTESLIAWLLAEDFSKLEADLHFHVFPTSYQVVDASLPEIKQAQAPDIVLHFGLAAEARGFRLEKIANSQISTTKPDVDGFTPNNCASEIATEQFSSSLPLDDLFTDLQELNLPVEFSEDAGGYLCNYLFYQTAGGKLGANATQMCGFIHVTLLTEQKSVSKQTSGFHLTQEQLLTGARGIIERCVSTWWHRYRST